MARMYRIPKPEPRKNDLLAVQIRVPAELQKIVGKTVLRRSTGTKDNREYYRRAPAIVLEFEVMLQQARERFERLQRPHTRLVQIIEPFKHLYRDHPYLEVEERDDGTMWVRSAVRDEEPDEPKFEALTPAAGCTTATAMALWKVKRGDNQPKQPAIDARASKMAKFLTWANRPDDLTRVLESDIQRYKEHLVATNPPDSNVARDHLTDIVALFNVADENRKFVNLPGGNPAAKIVLPPKRKGIPRLGFTDDEARLILLAAREEPEPIVRWGTWLHCFLGTITEEIADALVRHVKLVDGILCFDITTEGRTTIVDGAAISADLKTAFRPRLLPIHPALIREGFLDYVEDVRRKYGPRAPLFPEIAPDKYGQRNTRASTLTMRFLRRLGIENEVDPDTGKVIGLRDSYSWRHRFATQLEDMSELKPDRQRFMTGHSAPDVHGRIYLDHSPAKLKPFIDALPDPTAIEEDHVGGG